MLGDPSGTTAAPSVYFLCYSLLNSALFRSHDMSLGSVVSFNLIFKLMDVDDLKDVSM